MRKLFLASMICLVALSSCTNQGYNNNQGYNGYSNGQVVVNQPDIVVTPASNLGDNLNLQALGELVKTAKNAQDIENQLNTKGSINNLDLDGDGKVDYIKVTEYGTGTTKGFSFTVDLAGGQSQEVATIEIQQNGTQQASLNINGNQSVYGNNNSYSSNYSIADLMIMNYLFSPHGYYISPYHYGYYPSYYSPYGMMSSAAYGSRVSSVTRTSHITRTTTTRTSSIKSPNSQMSAKTVNTRSQALAHPTTSQKSFTRTAPSASRPSTSGFGSRSSSPSSSSSSRSSSSGRSSFGSSSRSSGGGRRSDMRFKTNINPLGNSLDKVCSLQGVTYDWRISAFPNENFESKRQIGFIAQDLEKVYPAVVNTRTDGYKTVDYDLLVPALVESIKELRSQNMKQDSIINLLLSKQVIETNFTQTKHIGGN